MSILFIKGNVLSAKNSIICQQTNCKGVMGKGLAREIRAAYPNVYVAYKKYCSIDNTNELLGTVLFVPVKGNIIANLFGQNNYGTDKQYTEYAALSKAFNRVAEVAAIRKMTIAIPYNLGCGLGGGIWSDVFSIIMTLPSDLNIRIYKL